MHHSARGANHRLFVVCQGQAQTTENDRLAHVPRLPATPRCATLLGMVLDIGCGTRKIEPDAVGIDASPRSAADRVWDLDRYPWPLEDDRFTRIHMSHIIEHLDDPMRAMAEVYRVARDGADVLIVTPHFSSHNSYVDPTHKRHLAAASFEYFTGKDFPSFTGAPF